MTPLILAAIALALAAFADGWTTVRAIRAGMVEVDRMMVWVFGTNTPSATIVYTRGMSIIAIEIAVAFALTHLVHNLGWVFVVGGFIQAAIHAYFADANYKLVRS